jgi:hypothetical protein
VAWSRHILVCTFIHPRLSPCDFFSLSYQAFLHLHCLLPPDSLYTIKICLYYSSMILHNNTILYTAHGHVSDTLPLTQEPWSRHSSEDSNTQVHDLFVRLLTSPNLTRRSRTLGCRIVQWSIEISNGYVTCTVQACKSIRSNEDYK